MMEWQQRREVHAGRLFSRVQAKGLYEVGEGDEPERKSAGRDREDVQAAVFEDNVSE